MPIRKTDDRPRCAVAAGSALRMSSSASKKIGDVSENAYRFSELGVRLKFNAAPNKAHETGAPKHQDPLDVAKCTEQFRQTSYFGAVNESEEPHQKYAENRPEDHALRYASNNVHVFAERFRSATRRTMPIRKTDACPRCAVATG
jgi:hypothetical protein